VHPRTWSSRDARLAALVPCLALLAACAAAAPRHRAPRVAQATPAAAKFTQPSARAAPGAAQPSSVFEESKIGEAAGLTPAPAAPATPAPEELAALSNPAAEAMPSNVTSAEPESLLSHIQPTTPPNVAAALRLIEEGRQQMKQSRYDQSLDRFERAVAIDPSNAYGYYFLAQLHYLKKDYDQTIAFASRAAVLSARSDRICLGRAYSLQGAAFEDVGRYPDARKAYQKAVEADPNNLAARVGVARLNPEE
jgi:tetratricopeptide (TPR) repeat protein